MPVVETTNTFLVEEVIKTKITQKLPEHKCVQVPSTEQLLEDGSVGKAQYSMQLPFPKCCLWKGLTLQSFCYFWIKKLKVFLELLIYDRIWGVLKGQKPLGNVWSVHVIGIFRGVERGSLRINPFHGEGMDNLWNYTIWNFGHYFHCRDNTYQSITAPNIWRFFSMQE